jgi:hypothetical protein
VGVQLALLVCGNNTDLREFKKKVLRRNYQPESKAVRNEIQIEILVTSNMHEKTGIPTAFWLENLNINNCLEDGG